MLDNRQQATRSTTRRPRARSSRDLGSLWTWPGRARRPPTLERPRQWVMAVTAGTTTPSTICSRISLIPAHVDGAMVVRSHRQAAHASRSSACARTGW